MKKSRVYVCAADASDGDAGANPEQDVSHLQLSFPAVTVVVPSSDARTLDQKHPKDPCTSHERRKAGVHPLDAS